MKLKPSLMKIPLLVLLAFGIAACSSKPNVKEFPKSANAKEEIYNLETAINHSIKEDVAILAPETFKDAKDALADAKEMEKNGKSDEDVLEEVALGRAYLVRATEHAKSNEARLRDVMAARDAAITVNANTKFTSHFNKLDNKISEQTSKIENDKKDDIKKIRGDLIAGYLDLELAAIKQENLGRSEQLINAAVQNGARELTPTTLNETNKKYQEAEVFISENRHKTSEIQARSAVVLASAKKLATTIDTARGISGTSTEETALRIQAEEERMTATQSALADEQVANDALAVNNSRLSENQRLDAMYETARQKFTKDEAEVYKKGNSLVIRMRGLEFPSAKATLRGDNFGLLKKVDDVIASFDQSKVMIEGHTDSVGGQALNQKLSNERAMAVKKYLEANLNNDNVSFQSRGFGFEKPLASNKSAEGRAQNRRVDVIIQPQQL